MPNTTNTHYQPSRKTNNRHRGPHGQRKHAQKSKKRPSKATNTRKRTFNGKGNQTAQNRSKPAYKAYRSKLRRREDYESSYEAKTRQKGYSSSEVSDPANRPSTPSNGDNYRQGPKNHKNRRSGKPGTSGNKVQNQPSNRKSKGKMTPKQMLYHSLRPTEKQYFKLGVKRNAYFRKKFEEDEIQFRVSTKVRFF